jgi:hypothetical protein
MFEYLGIHSELPLQHLKRGALKVISLETVVRRAHIIPIFKRGSVGPKIERFSSFFLVNTSVHPLVVGPRKRKIFLSCPHLCGGRIPQPSVFGSFVSCPSCSAQVLIYYYYNVSNDF